MSSEIKYEKKDEERLDPQEMTLVKFPKLESSPSLIIGNVVFDPQVSKEDLEVLLLFHKFEILTQARRQLYLKIFQV